MAELIFAAMIPVRARGQRKKIVQAGQYAKLVDPPKLKQFKKRVHDQVLAQYYPKPPQQGPIALEVIVRRPQPSSYHATAKERDEGEPVVAKKHYPDCWITRPDLDNVMKAFTDALMPVVLQDDSQIIERRTRKEHGNQHEIALRVWALGNGETLLFDDWEDPR